MIGEEGKERHARGERDRAVTDKIKGKDQEKSGSSDHDDGH